MTRRRRHALAACGVTLALAAAAVAGLTLSGSDSATAAPSSDEMPTALGAHLAKLSQAIPGNGGNPRRAPAARRRRSSPRSRIRRPTSRSRRSRAARCRREPEGRPFPNGKGKKGTWITVGPSNALYPATEFRNSFSYVPNEYSAGGRTTSLAIGPTCKPGQLPALASAPPAVASGARRTRSRAIPTGSSCPARSGSRRSARSRRPERRVGQHDLCRHGRGQLVGRLGAPASGSTSRRTAATRGPARSARPCSTRARSARSRSSRATRTPCTSGTTRARARRLVGLRRRRLGHPGRRRSGVSTSRRTAARAGRSSTTARRRRRRARATRPSRTTAPPARRAASAASSSTRRTRTIVYAGSYSRGIWRSTDGGRDVDADQAVAQRGS